MGARTWPTGTVVPPLGRWDHIGNLTCEKVGDRVHLVLDTSCETIGADLDQAQVASLAAWLLAQVGQQ